MKTQSKFPIFSRYNLPRLLCRSSQYLWRKGAPPAASRSKVVPTSGRLLGDGMWVKSRTAKEEVAVTEAGQTPATLLTTIGQDETMRQAFPVTDMISRLMRSDSVTRGRATWAVDQWYFVGKGCDIFLSNKKWKRRGKRRRKVAGSRFSLLYFIRVILLRRRREGEGEKRRQQNVSSSLHQPLLTHSVFPSASWDKFSQTSSSSFFSLYCLAGSCWEQRVWTQKWKWNGGGIFACFVRRFVEKEVQPLLSCHSIANQKVKNGNKHGFHFAGEDIASKEGVEEKEIESQSESCDVIRTPWSLRTPHHEFVFAPMM